MSALIIREMEARFGNKPGGYVWALVDPLAHVGVMTVVFSAVARTPPIGTDFALFFASGFLPFSFYHAMAGFMAGAIKANKSLFSYPIVAPFDAAIARFILQFITSVLVTILVMAICTSEIENFRALKLGDALAAVTVAALMGFGMGLTNIVLFGNYPLYEKVFTLINRPLYFLSGIIFLPEKMPKPIYEVLLWNPLVHVVMWFRQAVYPEYQARSLDKMYVLECASLLLMVGFCLFRASRALREDRI